MARRSLRIPTRLAWTGAIAGATAALAGASVAALTEGCGPEPTSGALCYVNLPETAFDAGLDGDCPDGAVSGGTVCLGGGFPVVTDAQPVNGECPDGQMYQPPLPA